MEFTQSLGSLFRETGEHPEIFFGDSAGGWRYDGSIFRKSYRNTWRYHRQVDMRFSNTGDNLVVSRNHSNGENRPALINIKIGQNVVDVIREGIASTIGNQTYYSDHHAQYGDDGRLRMVALTEPRVFPLSNRRRSVESRHYLDGEISFANGIAMPLPGNVPFRTKGTASSPSLDARRRIFKIFLEVQENTTGHQGKTILTYEPLRTSDRHTEQVEKTLCQYPLLFETPADLSRFVLEEIERIMKPRTNAHAATAVSSSL